MVENQKITPQNIIWASWTFNQALQEETNRDLQGALEINAGQRAFTLPESQGRDIGLPGTRGLSAVSSSFSLKQSENDSQERHLKGSCISHPGATQRPGEHQTGTGHISALRVSRAQGFGQRS